MIAGLIQTGLSLMTISPSLNEQFEVLANLAVITNIVPYFFCMAAMELIMIKAGHGSREELRLPVIASFVGSLYTLYACYAAGADAMMAAALVFFFGLTPVSYTHLDVYKRQPISFGPAVGIQEAEYVFVMRRLYNARMDRRDFKDDVIYEEWYSGKDEGNDHNLFIGEILTVYKKK